MVEMVDREKVVEDELREDLRLYGTAFCRFLPDGSKERLAPWKVVVNPLATKEE